MSDSDRKTLSQVSIKSQMTAATANSKQLARENLALQERITELQRQRDEALQRAHLVERQHDALAGRLVAREMTEASRAEPLQARLTAAGHELDEVRRQLDAATRLFWHDRAEIAQLEHVNRHNQECLRHAVTTLQRLANRGAARLVRHELHDLLTALTAEVPHTPPPRSTRPDG